MFQRKSSFTTKNQCIKFVLSYTLKLNNFTEAICVTRDMNYKCKFIKKHKDFHRKECGNSVTNPDKSDFLYEWIDCGF